MNDKVVTTCVSCKTEKHFGKFYRKYLERDACIFKRILKQYYNEKDEFLQKRRDKYASFKDLDSIITTLNIGRKVFNL